MKSERRHELEHNLLADWLSDTIQTIKPYQNMILGGIVLVAALVVVVSVWRSTAAKQDAVAWEQFYQAMQSGDTEELEGVATSYRGEQVGHWAAVTAGDQRLTQGCNLLFSDKPNAMEELRIAVDLYVPVLEESNETPLLERATFGLARAYEAQIDLDKATTRYKEIVDRWPNGPFSDVAKSRLKALESRSVRELADKFAKWEPKPVTADLPDFPASPPEFDLDALPDGPVFTPKTGFGMEGEDATAVPVTPPAEPAESDTETTKSGEDAAQPSAAPEQSGQEGAEASDAPASDPSSP